MPKETIFNKENSVLKSAKETLANENLSPELIKDELEKVVKAFEKLLKENEKLTKLGDIMDRKLFAYKEEIETKKNSLEEAIGKIRQLEGILPICASCKKIRNEENNWQQMEVYISAHSEADFSHGICPDCTTRLYPNFKPKK
ncbi:MAG: hypothetical protein DWQ06_01205 [Calditrichaeota bacterium]|nr:MAG: hypothetical protein DWQ06_01205 [Calditrichota bacterium]